MKTYSECTRQMIDEAEALYRAANNDVVEFVVADYTDEIRAAGYTARLMEYHLYRLATPATAAEWNTFAGAGAEAGYIHHSGVRRVIPVGVQAGWSVMNMGHQPYVDWQHANAVKLAKGTRYGAPQFTYPPPIAGVLMDLTLWYPAFDDDPAQPLATDPTPNIVSGTPSDEYVGTGDLYQTHCRNAYLGMQTALDTEFGTNVVRAYPNFGNLLFAADTDGNTLAIIAASKLVLVEEALKYTAGEPNLTAENCIARFATINTLLNGTRELMLDGHLVSPQDTAGKSRATIGVAAFMFLGYKAGMLSRFYYDPEDAAPNISTWEKNGYMRFVAPIVGNPADVTQELSGAWTKGKLFMREYTNGRAYLFVRKSGQAGSENAVVTLAQPMYVLNADNTYSTPVTSITFSLGEGAILASTADVFEFDAPTHYAAEEIVAPIRSMEIPAPIFSPELPARISGTQEVPAPIDVFEITAPVRPPKDKPLPEE